MLHSAILSNNIQRVRNLIILGADPNEKDMFGTTPLHIAAANNEKHMLIELLSNIDVNVNCTNNNGKTPLHIAIEKQCKTSVTYLLGCPEIDVEAKDSLGNTPIFYCSDHPDAVLLLFLLFSGANVNVTNNSLQTPLQNAICAENYNCVKYLLYNGANPNLQDIHGNTSLNDAVWEDTSNDIINILLEHGADPTIVDKDGLGCLHGAAWKGNYDTVDTLLNHIDPDIQCSDGMTPIYLAAMANHPDVVQLLLNNGANPNICKNDGKSPISITDDEITYIILLCNVELDEDLVTDDVCPICLENDRILFKAGCCNTYLHRDCAVEWGRKDCPICRGDMF